MSAVTCGRCKKRIKDSPQYCWFCGSELCYLCWDVHGHCGHEEANRINEECRKRDEPDLTNG